MLIEAAAAPTQHPQRPNLQKNWLCAFKKGLPACSRSGRLPTSQGCSIQ